MTQYKSVSPSDARARVWIVKCYTHQLYDSAAVLHQNNCAENERGNIMFKKLKSCTTKVTAAFLMMAILVSSVGFSATFAMEVDDPEIVFFISSVDMVAYDTYGNWELEEDAEVFGLPIKLIWQVVKKLGGILSGSSIAVYVADGVVQGVSTTGFSPLEAIATARSQALDAWRAGFRHLVVRHVIALPCGSWPVLEQTR